MSTTTSSFLTSKRERETQKCAASISTWLRGNSFRLGDHRGSRAVVAWQPVKKMEKKVVVVVDLAAVAAGDVRETQACVEELRREGWVRVKTGAVGKRALEAAHELAAFFGQDEDRKMEQAHESPLLGYNAGRSELGFSFLFFFFFPCLQCEGWPRTARTEPSSKRS